MFDDENSDELASMKRSLSVYVVGVPPNKARVVVESIT